MPKAAKRVPEFFTAQINNDHSRRAQNATHRFAEWCGAHGICRLGDVHAFRVVAFDKEPR